MFIFISLFWVLIGISFLVDDIFGFGSFDSDPIDPRDSQVESDSINESNKSHL